MKVRTQTWLMGELQLLFSAQILNFFIEFFYFSGECFEECFIHNIENFLIKKVNFLVNHHLILSIKMYLEIFINQFG